MCEHRNVIKSLADVHVLIRPVYSSSRPLPLHVAPPGDQHCTIIVVGLPYRSCVACVITIRVGRRVRSAVLASISCHGNRRPTRKVPSVEVGIISELCT